MKNQRTKVFQLRLTSDELLNLKEKRRSLPVCEQLYPAGRAGIYPCGCQTAD